MCAQQWRRPQSGFTEPGFIREENGAIKRQLFKWCESAMPLLAMPSRRREWCGEFSPPLPLSLKQSSGWIAELAPACGRCTVRAWTAKFLCLSSIRNGGSSIRPERGNPKIL